jgi:hypothetical protein
MVDSLKRNQLNYLARSYDVSRDYFISTAELLDSQVGAPVRARIFVTEANSKNANMRAYTPESLDSSIKAAQERVRLGLMVGYTDHPSAVYDKDRNFVGYNYKEKPPAFRVDKIWMDGLKVWADVTFLDNEAGLYYSEKIRNGEPVYVSSRGALGRGTRANGFTYYEVSEFEGFDIVKKPAVANAKVWTALTDAELKNVTESTGQEPDDQEEQDENKNLYGLTQESLDITDLTPDDVLAIVYSWPPEWQRMFIQLTVEWVQGVQGNGALGQMAKMGKSAENAVGQETEKPGEQPVDGNQEKTGSFGANKSDQAQSESDQNKPEQKNQQNASGNESDQGDQGNQSDTPEKKKKPAFYDSFRGLTPEQAVFALSGKLTREDRQRVIKELTDKLNEKVNQETETEKSAMVDIKKEEPKTGDNVSTEATKLSPLAQELLANESRLAAFNSMLDSYVVSEDQKKVVAFVDTIVSSNNKLPNGFAKQYGVESEIALLDGVDLSEVDEVAITELSKKSKERTDVKQALRFFTDGIQLLTAKGVKDKLEKKGFTDAQKKLLQDGKTEFSGKTGVEVVRNEQPYMPFLDNLNKATDRWRAQHMPTAKAQMETYSKVNKDFADMMWEERMKRGERDLLDAADYQLTDAKNARPLTDSQVRQLFDSANPIGADMLRNQPLITTEIERQVFWMLQSLQHMRGIGPSSIEPSAPGSSKFGRIFRFSALTYGAPTDGDEDFYVGPSEAIPEISFFLRYQEFATRFRALAMRLQRETMITLASGPINFEALAEGIAQMSSAMARQIDNNGWLEMQTAIDEHGRVKITGEAVAAAEWTWRTAGPLTVDGVKYGNSVYAVAKLLCGETTNALGDPIPLVRPRYRPGLALDGTDTATTDNDITISNTLGGVTQIRGKLDANADIVARNGVTGTPTYAPNYPYRHLVFANTGISGAAATVRPTGVNYSYATNFFRFDLTPPNGVQARDYYNSFLFKVTQEAARMWGTRYVFPNTMLGTATIMGGIVPIASEFYKLNSRAGATLNPGYAAGDWIGDFGNVNFMRTNGNLPDGDKRAMLFMKGMSAYGVGSPLQMSGPTQALIAPSGGGLVRLAPQWKYHLEMMDVFGTPLVIGPPDVNGDPTIYNFPGISCIFKGNVASV